MNDLLLISVLKFIVKRRYYF